MNSDMNKMIECGGEHREKCFCGCNEGRNNAEDDITDDAEKDMCNAKEEDTGGTDNNNENNAQFN